MPQNTSKLRKPKASIHKKRLALGKNLKKLNDSVDNKKLDKMRKIFFAESPKIRRNNSVRKSSSLNKRRNNSVRKSSSLNKKRNRSRDKSNENGKKILK